LQKNIAGRQVANDPGIGLKLYRVNGPVMILSHVRGLYPNDTWSGRTVEYTRVDCAAGRLSVLLGSDPALFSTDQVVTARANGRVVGRATVAPTAQSRLTVPVRPGPDGRCRVVFTVQRTKAPGGRDLRRLGAHFLSFDYAA
jgi:hypothetical protein